MRGSKSVCMRVRGSWPVQLRALAILSLWCGAAMAMEADNLTVVTSYPPSFFEPFQKAFSAREPDIQLTVVQRNTASAVRFIREKPDVPVDIFWASAADAFEVLKQQGQLRRTAPRPTGAPDTVSGYPVNDPDGFYLGFALSGYGFVYNPAYLAENRLPVPRTWSDLTSPIYSGHIGISAPSRSGTTHLIVEAILQTYGWDAGWALLSKLGGNLSTVTARSFGVASGVAQRRFGVGITIDFLGSAPNFPPDSTKFVLPPDTVFVPASIAILARSRNVAAAERFVDFALSEEGQELLLRPEINRIPVLPQVAAKADRNGIALHAGVGLLRGMRFDANLSARRYQLVNLVFDEYIVRKRAALARLWRQAAELAAINDPGSELAGALAEAVQYLGRPPVPREQATGDNELADLSDVPTGLPLPPKQAAFMDAVRTSIEHNLAEAERIMSQASSKYTLPGFKPWRR